jgi:hypothetical protein
VRTLEERKGGSGALTRSRLKQSKGRISTVDQEEHVVLDLRLRVKVTPGKRVVWNT